ncbi:carboxypeptidase-like regulatory domain-containing protein [Gilvimarinus xylanilyticus]|uniref:Carboxypeptidase-like regulatory domain-containing protein n=1 Tax=Gilvimarinus xylanilyticus TaxID=2944139 RepID=A0A9X2HUM2_9GAMM|nr:carboxypeptidase-like regulatory domain-containing protein [Gilvimarinus xylanilyticus]MCP8897949.1 carboxypeptidase-like regulatory domain-containing protein [Gilvimarinus xylanilyticus]
MKKEKLYLIVAALLILCIFGWLFWLFNGSPTEKISTEAPTEEALVDSAQADKMKKLIDEAKDDPEKSEGLFDALLALLPFKQRLQYRLSFPELDDMSFYGQVVDQYGDPVVGATLDIEGGGRLLTPGSGKARARTDAEGKFSVHMKGGSLLITNLSHPGVKYYFPNDLRSTGSGGIGFDSFQRMKGGNEPLWSDYPQGNPYVFQAWRIDPNDLVTNLKSGRDNFRVDCENNTYSIDMLVSPRSKKRLVLDGLEGQLRVRFSCEEALATETADWTVEIEAIDGGLVATDERYMYKAPDFGYVPSIRWTFNKNDSNYRGGLSRKKFYFYSNNGKEYGSLILSFDIFYEGPILMIDKYNINPDGGRSLLGPDRGY